MRKNRFIWMIATILLCGLTVVSLTACSSDDPEPAPENPEEQGDPSSDVDWTAIHNELQPQLVDSASVSMYDFFNDIYENATQGNDPEDELRAAWAKMNMDKLYHQQIPWLRQRGVTAMEPPSVPSWEPLDSRQPTSDIFLLEPTDQRQC